MTLHMPNGHTLFTPSVEKPRLIDAKKLAAHLTDVLGRPISRWAVLEWVRNKSMPPSCYTRITPCRIMFVVDAVNLWLSSGSASR